MKKTLQILSISVAISVFSGTVKAGLKEGLNAYNKKDYITAANEFLPLAEQGNGEAAFQFAIMNYNGLGILRDRAAALKWFKIAAAQGYDSALNALAKIYLINRDKQTSLCWLSRAANSGSNDAQQKLNDILGPEKIREQNSPLYSTGPITGNNQSNIKKAIDAFRFASDNGDGTAAYSISSMYRSGQGVEKNDAKAGFWARKSAFQGDPNGQFIYGLNNTSTTETKSNDALGTCWLQTAAQNGSKEAAKMLARVMDIGDDKNSDNEPSYDDYREAALLGNPGAAMLLGLKLWIGKDDVAQNKTQALHWLKIAHKLGNPKAAENLYLFYSENDGENRNTKQIIKWLKISANQGNAEHQYYLGREYLLGGKIKQNISSGLNWLKLSADQNYANANLSLALMFAKGSGVDSNRGRAAYYFQRAIDWSPDNEKARLESLRNEALSNTQSSSD